MSLRKVAGVRIEKSGWLFPAWRFIVSKKGYFELSNRQYLRAREQTVAMIGVDGGRALWWTSYGFFRADPDLAAEDVELLVWDRSRKHDAKLDRLRKIRARDEEVTPARRRAIPDEVRAFVWRRDQGRCVRGGGRPPVRPYHPRRQGRRERNGQHPDPLRRL